VAFALASTVAFDSVPPSLIMKITGLWLWRKWSVAQVVGGSCAVSWKRSVAPRTVGDDGLRGGYRAE
jgi:hypothetical protein